MKFNFSLIADLMMLKCQQIELYIYLQEAKMKHHQHRSKPKHKPSISFGPIKIKDGLFLGDQLAAKDIEFVIGNKVTHVINTVQKRVPNMWEKYGVQYLSVHWTEKEHNIFDKKNNAVNSIYNFIEEAMELGQSCLIHSMHGKSRASAVIIAYFMKKHSWSLPKCLQFLTTKKQTLEIRENFMKQLKFLQQRLSETHPLSSSWADTRGEQDLLITNTFKNIKVPLPEPTHKPKPKKRITWGEKTVIKERVNMIGNSYSSVKPEEKTFKSKGKLVRSILKGDKDKEKEKEGGQVTDSDDRKGDTVNVNHAVNNYTTESFKNNSRISYAQEEQVKKNNDVYQKMSSTFQNHPDSHHRNEFDSHHRQDLDPYHRHDPKRYQRDNSKSTAHQRPQSANIKKGKTPIPIPTSYKRDEFNYGKRRNPSIQKQELYKWR